MKTEQQLREEYYNIFGEKHHDICEGKNCECHKEVFNWIQQQIAEAKQEILDRMKERMDKKIDWEGETWHAYEQIRLEQELINNNEK